MNYLRKIQLYEFVWTLRSSVWVVFNHFLLIDVTDRSKINSNHHRIRFDGFDVSLYLLSFFTNTLFKWVELCIPDYRIPDYIWRKGRSHTTDSSRNCWYSYFRYFLLNIFIFCIIYQTGVAYSFFLIFYFLSSWLSGLVIILLRFKSIVFNSEDEVLSLDLDT